MAADPQSSTAGSAPADRELVDVRGRTYEEAAEQLGVPLGTIMSRLHRARKRIKKQLEAAGLGPRETS